MTIMLKKIKPELVRNNPFQAIGRDWMLITAGTMKNFNMMTASWGGWGVLWHKNVCFCFIRPHRYTYEFMEKAKYFTLSYFDKKYKKILEFCGTKSGRDVNKMEESRLTPQKGPFGTVYFKEARLAVVARKIYFQEINPDHFLDSSIQKNYPRKDYHRMYVGEITHCLARAGRIF